MADAGITWPGNSTSATAMAIKGTTLGDKRIFMFLLHDRSEGLDGHEWRNNALSRGEPERIHDGYDRTGVIIRCGGEIVYSLSLFAPTAVFGIVAEPAEQAEQYVIRWLVLRVQFEHGPLEVLHRVGLAIGVGL